DSLLTAATSHARGVAAPPIEWARLRRDTSVIASPTDSVPGGARVSVAAGRPAARSVPRPPRAPAAPARR
ncbi:MAG TPA: hypothetical protein VMS88_04675, partial [Terriglobales bacterium]|nr:hypothetical protein [Terriglobales bacterium]